MKTLDKNASIKDAILYFNDDACSLYSTEKDVIKKFENEFAAKIPVYSVNAQEQTDLVKRYGVLSAPSVVLIKDGQKIDQFNKYMDLNQIKIAATYYLGGMKND